jgi:hypothetical protein
VTLTVRRAPSCSRCIRLRFAPLPLSGAAKDFSLVTSHTNFACRDSNFNNETFDTTNQQSRYAPPLLFAPKDIANTATDGCPQVYASMLAHPRSQLTAADVEELQKKKQSDMMRFLMRVRVRIHHCATSGLC